MRKYFTYTEAKKVVQEAGFRSSLEYNARYKQFTGIPRLPSEPYVLYKEDWQGWRNFLFGESKHLSYEEACKVVQAAGFSSVKDYLAGFKSIPGLPSNPGTRYKDQWVNWIFFLTGKDTITKCSFEEARALVREHGVKGKSEYIKLAREFGCLPVYPDEYYSEEWIDSYHFFGKARPEEKYSTEIAREIALKAGVKTIKEYRALQELDDRLPKDPHLMGEIKGFRHFMQFPTPEPKYTFEEAKKVVRALGIKNSKEYINGLGYQRDPRLPAKPERTYKASWKGWQDYIGGTKKQFLCYEKAKEAVRALGIVNFTDYMRRYRKVEGLPVVPFKIYQSQWEGWPSFLGQYISSAQIRRNQFMTYEAAQQTVRSLQIKNLFEYQKRYKEVNGLPCSPHSVYAGDWKGWHEFLGKKGRPQFVTYEEAQQTIRNLKINSINQYQKRYKEVNGLPCSPPMVYAGDWKGWHEFLGIMSRPKSLSYEEAQRTVRSLNINSISQYKKRYKEVAGLPSAPTMFYASDWKNWYEFFGKKDWPQLLTYEEAQQTVRSLKIKSGTEYNNHYKEVNGLPSNPSKYYVDDWKGWHEFLGIMSREKLLTYEEARQTVRSLKINSINQYKKRYTEVNGLPSKPEMFYASDWKNWYEFFGKRGSPQFTYEEAQQAIRSLQIKNVTEYRKRYKEVNGLPSDPRVFYEGDWKGWSEFFGKKIKAV